MTSSLRSSASVTALDIVVALEKFSRGRSCIWRRQISARHLISSSLISNPTMSIAAFTCNSNPNPMNLSHRSIRRRNGVLFMAIPTRRANNSSSISLFELVLRIPRSRRNPICPRVMKSASPVMEWQNCTAKMEVDIPASVAYKCYSDREAIPQWMPFISSVKVLEDNPTLSRWSLKYNAFGQDINYSWLARNLQPTLNQKIHWRSLEGLPNRGVVRFYPKGPSSCLVELTVSYEVPPVLYPVASALQPLLERLLKRGLESFATFAKKYQTA